MKLCLSWIAYADNDGQHESKSTSETKLRFSNDLAMVLTLPCCARTSNRQLTPSSVVELMQACTEELTIWVQNCLHYVRPETIQYEKCIRTEEMQILPQSTCQ